MIPLASATSEVDRAKRSFYYLSSLLNSPDNVSSHELRTVLTDDHVTKRLAQGLALFSSTGTASNVTSSVKIDEGARIELVKQNPDLTEAVLGDLLSIIHDRLRGCYHVAFSDELLPKDQAVLSEELAAVVHTEKCAMFDAIAGIFRQASKEPPYTEAESQSVELCQRAGTTMVTAGLEDTLWQSYDQLSGMTRFPGMFDEEILWQVLEVQVRVLGCLVAMYHCPNLCTIKPEIVRRMMETFWGERYLGAFFSAVQGNASLRSSKRARELADQVGDLCVVLSVQCLQLHIVTDSAVNVAANHPLLSSGSGIVVSQLQVFVAEWVPSLDRRAAGLRDEYCPIGISVVLMAWGILLSAAKDWVSERSPAAGLANILSRWHTSSLFGDSLAQLVERGHVFCSSGTGHGAASRKDSKTTVSSGAAARAVFSNFLGLVCSTFDLSLIRGVAAIAYTAGDVHRSDPQLCEKFWTQDWYEKRGLYFILKHLLNRAPLQFETKYFTNK